MCHMNSAIDRSLYFLWFYESRTQNFISGYQFFVKIQFLSCFRFSPHKTIVDIQEGWDEMFYKIQVKPVTKYHSGVLLDNLQSHSMEMPSSPARLTNEKAEPLGFLIRWTGALISCHRLHLTKRQIPFNKYKARQNRNTNIRKKQNKILTV